MKLDNFEEPILDYCPFCKLNLLRKGTIEFTDLPETLFFYDHTDQIGDRTTRFVYQCQNCQASITLEREKYNDN